MDKSSNLNDLFKPFLNGLYPFLSSIASINPDESFGRD